MTLGSIAGSVIVAGIDFHFCRVMKYHALHPVKGRRENYREKNKSGVQENFSDSDFDDKIANPYDQAWTPPPGAEENWQQM